MFLSYNDISLQVETVQEFSQTPVVDPSGNDYLYTHIRIRVRAVWNPRATAQDVGIVAAESIDALRHSLVQPRKLLRFTVPSGGNAGEKIILESPLLNPDDDRYPCDAKNGPIPLGLPIIQVIGEKTAIVDFAIETWINECPAARPILSHRWSSVHDIDRDFYTTRTISGEAIFRTDLMAQGETVNGVFRPLLPDDFRGILFAPCPNNFKRESIRVESSRDGTSLRYTVVDREQPALINPQWRAITRIEGMFMEHKGIGTIGAKNTVAMGRAGNAVGSGIGAVIGAIVGGAIDFAGVFPPMTYRLNVRAWGNRYSDRQTIVAALTTVLAAFRLDSTTSAVAANLSYLFVDKVTNVDIFGKFAEITATLHVPSEANAVRNVLAAGNLLLPPSASLMPENIGEIIVVDTQAGHAPKNNSGTRGSYQAHLVHQLLQESCANPSAPDSTGAERDNGAFVNRKYRA